MADLPQSVCSDAGSALRSDRLLRAMKQVFCHDLPNQMTVLQSLLQLLNADEAEHLGADGKEYIERLQHALLRACEQVRFLKEMGQINTREARAEPIELAMLARELQAILQQKHPRKQLTFAWQWQAPSIVGDVRTFTLALTELFAVLLRAGEQNCRISAESRILSDGIELAFRVEEQSASNRAMPRWTAEALANRMEIALAREWLALSSARLQIVIPADGTIQWVIAVPNR